MFFLMPSCSLKLHKWRPWVVLNWSREKEEKISFSAICEKEWCLLIPSGWVRKVFCIENKAHFCLESSFLPWWQKHVVAFSQSDLYHLLRTYKGQFFTFYTCSLFRSLLSVLLVGYDEPVASLLQLGCSSLSPTLRQGRVSCPWSVKHCPLSLRLS